MGLMVKGPNRKKRRPAARRKKRTSGSHALKGLLSKIGLKKKTRRKSTKSKRRAARPKPRNAKRVVRRRQNAKPFWQRIEWRMPDWVKRMIGFGVRLSSIALTGVLIGLMGLVVLGDGLPMPDMDTALARPPRITLVDSHGLVITSYGSLYGSPVDVRNLPPHVVEAFIATEDRNFYHHLGVNPVAIGRALLVNFKAGEVRQGGSTITQQVAKNLFLSADRTLNRKAQEILISFWLELNYSKDEILGLYLNHMYFGAGTYGIDAAAERYFRKAPSQLTIGEAAMLAGLLKAPSDYSPTVNPEAATERAKLVLNAMFEAGYLTAAEVQSIKTGVVAKAAPRSYAAAYAVDYAIGEANRLLGGINEDVVIRTTIDLKAHQILEPTLHDLSDLAKPVPTDAQVAMVAMEKDGALRVLIGGRNYAKSEYNRATIAKRQPGSAFKPFVYLTATEQGIRPDDMVIDAPVELDGWTPGNYKNRYYGAVTLTEALSRSLNAAAISLQETVGRDQVIRTANRFGFSVAKESGPALALGVFETTPLQLTSAYASFATEGQKVTPYIISEIESEDGRLLYRHVPKRPEIIAKRDAVRALNHMLRATAETGSGFRANLAAYATYGKTGTTQESRDAWFAGHAGGLAGTVWVGLDNSKSMHVGKQSVSGAGAPAILWHRMMQAALNGRPDQPLPDWTPPRPKWRFPFPLRAERSVEERSSIILDASQPSLPAEEVSHAPLPASEPSLDAYFVAVEAEQEPDPFRELLAAEDTSSKPRQAVMEEDPVFAP